mmetsp:Transcript_25806/g.103079  ORF Transcript_25806/g.103079 Transcript_25806/m.103079 type:complete len:285 (-) Transcript_25806:225-1079(-)
MRRFQMVGLVQTTWNSKRMRVLSLTPPGPPRPYGSATQRSSMVKQSRYGMSSIVMTVFMTRPRSDPKARQRCILVVRVADGPMGDRRRRLNRSSRVCSDSFSVRVASAHGVTDTSASPCCSWNRARLRGAPSARKCSKNWSIVMGSVVDVSSCASAPSAVMLPSEMMLPADATAVTDDRPASSVVVWSIVAVTDGAPPDVVTPETTSAVAAALRRDRWTTCCWCRCDCCGVIAKLTLLFAGLRCCGSGGRCCGSNGCGVGVTVDHGGPTPAARSDASPVVVVVV